MKATKYIAVLILIFSICFPAYGEKRVKPKPMKELTEPKSPSFVPYPYPKNREEIIADLKHYVEKYCNDTESVWIGEVPSTEIVLKNLLEPSSIYKIGKIIKVKNRSHKESHDYSWLIYIMDLEGKVIMRAALDAYGLYIMGGALREQDLESVPNPKDREKLKRSWKLLTDEDIRNILSDSLGRSIGDHEIKKMSRVAYYSKLGDFLCPLWEIEMADGKIYYYSMNGDMIYNIEKKISWKKYNNGYRTPPGLLLEPNQDYLPDTINDELVVLKAHPRGKKQ
jgi:hypothetical protein